jgi:hypothetical protein
LEISVLDVVSKNTVHLSLEKQNNQGMNQ